MASEYIPLAFIVLGTSDMWTLDIPRESAWGMLPVVSALCVVALLGRSTRDSATYALALGGLALSSIGAMVYLGTTMDDRTPTRTGVHITLQILLLVAAVAHYFVR
jgi:hypothetical protein